MLLGFEEDNAVRYVELFAEAPWIGASNVGRVGSGEEMSVEVGQCYSEGGVGTVGVYSMW